MSTYKPDNITNVSPYLVVQDASATMDFYEKAFGFGLEDKLEEDGKVIHAHMKHKDSSIMFGPEGAYDTPHRAPKTSGTPPSASLYLYCENVDKMYDRALGAGAQSLMEPQDSFWGDRICKVADPNGHEFMFATSIGSGN